MTTYEYRNGLDFSKLTGRQSLSITTPVMPSRPIRHLNIMKIKNNCSYHALIARNNRKKTDIFAYDASSSYQKLIKLMIFVQTIKSLISNDLHIHTINRVISTNLYEVEGVKAHISEIQECLNDHDNKNPTEKFIYQFGRGAQFEMYRFEL